nr:MAG TPA: hypothetical protein [Caudoviricetes sp.]
MGDLHGIVLCFQAEQQILVPAHRKHDLLIGGNKGFSVVGQIQGQLHRIPLPYFDGHGIPLYCFSQAAG